MKPAIIFLLSAAYFLTFSTSYGMQNSSYSGNNRQMLDRALFDCDTEKLTSLLADYPDLAHFRNSIDYTPLHALAGKLFCTDCLLQLNTPLTPEHQATLKQKNEAIQDMIRLLVQHSANINALKSTKIGVNKHQAETPLLHACHHSCAQTVATLLACGADAQACNSKGNNGFHYLATRLPQHLSAHCLTEMVTLLKNAGAPIDAVNNLHWTPLMSALQQENIQSFNALLAAGANTDIPDNNGMTVLHYAIQKQNIELVATLLARDAQQTTSPWGATCLQMAQETGNRELMEKVSQPYLTFDQSS